MKVALIFSLLLLNTIGEAKSTKNVILISIDGLKDSAVTATGTPNLYQRIQTGQKAISAKSALPPRTIPNHTTMLTGLNPTTHGLLKNSSSSAKTVEHPTIFDILFEQKENFTGAAVIGKKKLAYLVSKDGPEKTQTQLSGAYNTTSSPVATDTYIMQAIRYKTNMHGTKQTKDLVLETLDSGLPNLLFIHFSSADFSGHYAGYSAEKWDSPEYLRQVKAIDSSIAEIITKVESIDSNLSETVFVVTSDHGGHFSYGAQNGDLLSIKNINHGDHGVIKNAEKTGLDKELVSDVLQLVESDFLSVDLEIPWIIFGGESQKYSISSDIHQVDTAPTVLQLLGAEIPKSFEGSSAVFLECFPKK
jgi:predicted AlkP superfamily pyrophosphatase or phosphodiesterase